MSFGLAGSGQSRGPPVRVPAVAGLAGVGKTELVLQAAHAALRNGWFPGGVLFHRHVRLCPQRKVEAGAASEGMPRTVRIPGEHILAEAQDRSRLFSSVMAAYAKEGRPVLVVVDNASSAAQVRPLLPAGGKAVITFGTPWPIWKLAPWSWMPSPRRQGWICWRPIAPRRRRRRYAGRGPSRRRTTR
jgi:hypothetical protein